MKKKILLYFLLTLLCFRFQTYISVFAEETSTPDPVVSIFPNIIINEIGFKDSNKDWIELYVINGGNIKGLNFWDDKVFFSVTYDLLVNTGDYILISFNNAAESYTVSSSLKTFDIIKSGLTGTTEQVIIKNEDEILDAVCWANSSPTETEIKNFDTLAESDQWTAGITTCIKSEDVKTNYSVGRKNLIDTNSKNDWEIISAPTKGFTNEKPAAPETTATPEPTTEENEDEEDPVVMDSPTIVSVPPVEKPKNTCTTILINEIFPNPEGSDTGNEWIELFNPGEQCIMDGWSVDDAEGGSKPFNIYNETINKNGFLLLPSWKTKITLNNSNESVRLFDHTNKLADSISYTESAKENMSYEKNADGEFIWTNKITPLAANTFESDDYIDAEAEEDETDDKKQTTKTAALKKAASATIKNGDLSENIHITELMPNPSGTDKGSEWVEIHNDLEKKINLGGWIIDIGESSTKKYTFNNVIIEAGEYIVLSDTDLGITLKNSSGVLRLLDYEKTVIDLIEYGSAPDNSSYMRVKIIGNEQEEDEWKWTKNSTKGEENPVLYKFTGEITNFNQQTGELILKTTDEELTIMVENSGDELINVSFKAGAIINLTAKMNQEGKFMMQDYEIVSQSDNNNSDGGGGFMYIILSTIPPAGFLGFIWLKKFGIIKF
ncbi:lamin tail domain-containing protein [Candidatus Peregrinibacteria bacterium]|nr:lamin tail domain-containing protein [Candidatus Peregrinibacteria bacterium]